MNDQNIHNLVCAIILQAAKDFFAGTDEQRKVVLKDLRSPYMDFVSNGISVVVAEQLEKHPEEVAVNMRQYHEMT